MNDQQSDAAADRGKMVIVLLRRLFSRALAASQRSVRNRERTTTPTRLRILSRRRGRGGSARGAGAIRLGLRCRGWTRDAGGGRVDRSRSNRRRPWVGIGKSALFQRGRVVPAKGGNHPAAADSREGVEELSGEGVTYAIRQSRQYCAHLRPRD